MSLYELAFSGSLGGKKSERTWDADRFPVPDLPGEMLNTLFQYCSEPMAIQLIATELIAMNPRKALGIFRSLAEQLPSQELYRAIEVIHALSDDFVIVNDEMREWYRDVLSSFIHVLETREPLIPQGGLMQSLCDTAWFLAASDDPTHGVSARKLADILSESFSPVDLADALTKKQLCTRLLQVPVLFLCDDPAKRSLAFDEMLFLHKDLGRCGVSDRKAALISANLRFAVEAGTVNEELGRDAMERWARDRDPFSTLLVLTYFSVGKLPVPAVELAQRSHRDVIQLTKEVGSEWMFLVSDRVKFSGAIDEFLGGLTGVATWNQSDRLRMLRAVLGVRAHFALARVCREELDIELGKALKKTGLALYCEDGPGGADTDAGGELAPEPGIPFFDKVLSSLPLLTQAGFVVGRNGPSIQAALGDRASEWCEAVGAEALDKMLAPSRRGSAWLAARLMCALLRRTVCEEQKHLFDCATKPLDRWLRKHGLNPRELVRYNLHDGEYRFQGAWFDTVDHVTERSVLLDHIRGIRNLEEVRPGSARQLRKHYGIRSFGSHSVAQLVRQVDLLTAPHTNEGAILVVNPIYDHNGAIFQERWAEKIHNRLRAFDVDMPVVVIELGRALELERFGKGITDRSGPVRLTLVCGHSSGKEVEVARHRGIEFKDLERWANNPKFMERLGFESAIIYRICYGGKPRMFADETAIRFADSLTLTVGPNGDAYLKDIRITKRNGEILLYPIFGKDQAKVPAFGYQTVEIEGAYHFETFYNPKFRLLPRTNNRE